MAEKQNKATPPSGEQLKTETGSDKTLLKGSIGEVNDSNSDNESNLTELQEDLEVRELAVSGRETKVEEREAAVSLRETTVLGRETKVEERENAVSQREADIEEREKNFNPVKPEEAVKGLEFEFQDEKFKFKDSAPKALRFDGSVMTQSQMIEDEDIILDLVSSNSVYIEKL